MNNTPDIVLLTDHTEVLYLQKTLGPLKIASELRAAGFSVQVINHLHVFSVDEIRKILSETVGPNTLFVGFSDFFYKECEDPVELDTNAHDKGGIEYKFLLPGALLPHGVKYNAEIRSLIKTLNPKCKLVLGGPNAKDASYVSIYDYVVLGYADLAVIRLAEHLARQTPLGKYNRSVFGPIIIDGGKAEDYNFVETPMQYHESDIILPGETLACELSRGCIFNCSFCAFPLKGKKKTDHIKLEQILIDEFIENYEKFGITRYMFSDDTFNDSREKIEMVHRISRALPFQLEFWCYARLDLLAAHPDTIDLLYESGLRACYFGIETLDPKAATLIGKGGSRKKLIDAIALIKQKYGDKIMLNGSFIFGLPGESLSSMQETVRQLESGEILLDSYQLQPLMLRPGNWSQTIYRSEFDINYAKYGYRILEEKNEMLYWESDITSYVDCVKLVHDCLLHGIQSGLRKIQGKDVFWIAGLGLGLDHARNQFMDKFDWHSVDITKQKRAQQYKELLFKHLDMVSTVS